MKNKELVLSMSALREICRGWAAEVGKEFRPDLIVFIAKSGFVIGDVFAKELEVPLREVIASRPGGTARRMLAPVFKKIPLRVRNMIVGSGFMYLLNDRKKERNVYVPDCLRIEACNNKYHRILLIDDSVDTGWSFIAVLEQIRNLFPMAEVRTLSLIEMSYSNKRFRVDYMLYKDLLLVTPAQIDSEEYNLFLSQYNSWRESVTVGQERRC